MPTESTVNEAAERLQKKSPLETQGLTRLFIEVSKLVDHSKEIARLKGENFNVFSILKMETSENATHSAFIAELLNPNGSHLKGSVFLELFLEAVEHKDFDCSNARVEIEKHIGRISSDGLKGGRVDIAITDNMNRTICIENKIYAADQANQIARYIDFNAEKNKVYYLTLEGGPSGGFSASDSVGEETYQCISYREHIIDWLKRCMREAAEEPILRETIKQYIILIKKLTGLLTNQQMENELHKLIIDNYASAKVISDNFNTAVNGLREELRNNIRTKLEDQIDPTLEIMFGPAVDRMYSSLWIKRKARKDNSERGIGIEAFSGIGHLDGDLFYGIGVSSNDDKVPEDWEGSVHAKGWYHVNRLEIDGERINLGSASFLKKYNDDKDNFRERVTNHIVEEFLQFYKDYKWFLLE